MAPKMFAHEALVVTMGVARSSAVPCAGSRGRRRFLSSIPSLAAALLLAGLLFSCNVGTSRAALVSSETLGLSKESRPRFG